MIKYSCDIKCPYYIDGQRQKQDTIKISKNGSEYVGSCEFIHNCFYIETIIHELEKNDLIKKLGQEFVDWMHQNK